jgi:malate dehydrogenase (oxaloacetate-decarboxylating)(NADP+)
MERRRFSEALDYHERGRPGKLEVRPTKPTATQADLSLAYTPGVAEPCREIAEDPDAAFRFTNRGNLVAVVSNGTAVLGLGDIGPLAGKPVMEGKGVLFKRFADIDVYDLEVDSADPAEVIRFCEMLAPTVGGINLEDIKAPECFVIEDTLREHLEIPVFHDDQHGTAIIAGAALLNAVELTGRDLAATSVVISGAGAAGIATARFLLRLGATRDRIVLLDSRGVIRTDRDGLTPHKAEFATAGTDIETLPEALAGADVFIGVSVAGTVTREMVRSMADSPIVFALANPDPEIPYDEAKAARSDAIVATGRSDYPNQVNNVLGFPFIFRGALDVRSTAITEGMKVAAAQALAALAKEPVPDTVLATYGLERLEFGPEYLIPKPFDVRVLWHVAPAVAVAATEEGTARRPLEDPEGYAVGLRRRFRASFGLVRAVTVKAQEEPMRVVYPHAADSRILRAARRVVDEGIGRPILLAEAGDVNRMAVDLGLDLSSITVIEPGSDPELCARYAADLLEARRHRGMTAEEAARLVADPNYVAALMLRAGEADAVLGGLTTAYPDTLRPALQLLPLEPGRTIVSAVYAVVIGARSFFLADCAVNIAPTAAQLAEIALSTAELARSKFDVWPRVALLSYSDFGSAGGAEAELVREAVRIARERDPELPLDGEMQADTAVVGDLLLRRHPGTPLGREANVLVFPTLTAANAAYKLLHRLAQAEVIGPILTGLSRSVHVLQRDADAGEVVNLTAIAVADAQRKRPGG